MDNSYHGIWHFLFGWQTLIAGVLAVISAVGAIWATIASANREIAAANRQVETAQKQIEAALNLDRLHSLEERYAFLTALEAVAIDAKEKLTLGKPWILSRLGSLQRKRETEFAVEQLPSSMVGELRGACVRMGNDLVQPLINLDRSISVFASRWGSPNMNDMLDTMNFAQCSSDFESLQSNATTPQEMCKERLGVCSQQLSKLKVRLDQAAYPSKRATNDFCQDSR